MIDVKRSFLTISMLKDWKNLEIADTEYDAVFGVRYSCTEIEPKGYSIIINNTDSSIKLLLFGSFIPRINDSLILEANRLVFLLDDIVYAVDRFSGTLLSENEIRDGGQLFAIYPFDGGYIIHGEMEIIKLSDDFKEQWSFSGRDIFVHPIERECFKIKNNKIELSDFQGNNYTLNQTGNCIYDSKGK